MDGPVGVGWCDVLLENVPSTVDENGLKSIIQNPWKGIKIEESILSVTIDRRSSTAAIRFSTLADAQNLRSKGHIGSRQNRMTVVSGAHGACDGEKVAIIEAQDIHEVLLENVPSTVDENDLKSIIQNPWKGIKMEESILSVTLDRRSSSGAIKFSSLTDAQNLRSKGHIGFRQNRMTVKSPNTAYPTAVPVSKYYDGANAVLKPNKLQEKSFKRTSLKKAQNTQSSSIMETDQESKRHTHHKEIQELNHASDRASDTKSGRPIVPAEPAFRTRFIQVFHHGCMKLLSIYSEKKLNVIEVDLQQFHVKISAQGTENKKNMGFHVSGLEEGASKAVHRINELIASVVSESRVIQQPGMPKFLKSEGSRLTLHGIESMYRVFVEVTDMDMDIKNQCMVETSAVQFVIWAFDNTAIMQAFGAVDKIYAEQKAEKVLGGTEVDNALSEVIKTLEPDEIERIEKIGSRLDVLVSTDVQTGTIKIQGLLKDVSEAELQIQKYQHGLEMHAEKKREAARLAQFVQWEFENESENFEPFRDEISGFMEMDCSPNKKMEMVTKLHGIETTISVDLVKCILIIGQHSVKIRRREKVGFTLPDYWTQMDKNYEYKLVSLDVNDQEYKHVVDEFCHTAPWSIIVQVQRLQNPFLYRRYMVHKMDMESKTDKPVERQLWHGTHLEVIQNINTNGFNRSYCGRHGVAYGKGVYFARDASYSVQFAPKDSKRRCYMYYASVLTGNFCKGNKAMLEPPHNECSGIRYDSTVNDTHNPSKFVVYSDTQVYPSYLVTFECFM